MLEYNNYFVFDSESIDEVITKNEKEVESEVVVKNRKIARLDFLFIDKKGEEIRNISSSKHLSINNPEWFQKKGVGYVVESDALSADIEFVCESDCDIAIRLRSKDIREKEDKSKRILYFVDYKKFAVNNNVLLDENRPANHDDFIDFNVHAKAGQKINFHAEWDVHLDKEDILKVLRLKTSLEEVYDDYIELSDFKLHCDKALVELDSLSKRSCADFCEVEIRDFLERNGITTLHGDDWYSLVCRNTKYYLIYQTVRQWCRLSDKVKHEGLDILIRCWSRADDYVSIISYMMTLMGDKKKAVTDAFSKYFAGIQKKKKTPKVIGAYYSIYSNGGIQRVLSKLMQIWVEMGYEVIFITDTEVLKQDYDLPEGVTRVRLDSTTDDNRRGYSLSSLIRKYNIDTFVYHDYLNKNLLHDLLICKCMDVSFILYYHSIFSKYLLLDDKRFYNIPHIASCADLMVVLNEVNRKYWVNFNGNVHVVMNPLVFDLNDISESKKDNKNIIWVGRLDKYKRYDDPIYIMEKVLEKHSDAKLMIVGGDESNSIYNSLKSKVNALNLQDNIILYGFQKDVGRYYTDASIFLMTSTHEGYPMALLEALSYGLPVVMYNLPYLTMVKDNQSIISVEQADVDGAAEELVELLDNRNKIKELGSAARRYVEEMYAGDKLKKQWQEIFDSVESCEYSRPEKDEVISTILDSFKIGLELREKGRG